MLKHIQRWMRITQIGLMEDLQISLLEALMPSQRCTIDARWNGHGYDEEMDSAHAIQMISAVRIEYILD